MAARFVDVSESEIDQKNLFSRIIINVITLKQLVASGDVNIGDYLPIFPSPSATNIVKWLFYLLVL